MKKVSILILIFLIGFSCKDFLKEESKSQMTLSYYQTDRGLYEGVAAVYSTCRELYRENMFRINYYSDLTENGSSANNTYDFTENVSWGGINELFRSLHKGIMIINRIERIIGEKPDNRTKEIYLAELRGFRAHFYQIQVELWGRYGHYQEEIYDNFENSMLNINQQSVEFFYKQILSDVDYAIEKLPKKSELKEFGRLSQGAAKAFKARFLLAIAGYSHPEYSGQPEFNLYQKLGFTSIQKLYKEAKTLATSVINDYGYTLESEYWKVFDEANQTNNEIIWSVQWTTDKVFNTDWQAYHRNGIGRTCETLKMKVNNDGSTTASTKSLVVKRLDNTNNPYTYSMPCHSMYYGREYRHYMPTFAWINMFSDDDKRKKACFETVFLKIDDDKAAPKDLTDTICYMPFRIITAAEEKKYDDWVASGDPKAYFIDGMNEVYDLDDPNDKEHYGGPLKHRSRYYNVKKFYDRSRTEMGKQNEGNKNGIILRLAEMYLIVAECNWKLKLGDQAIYEALEPLWKRSFDNLQKANAYKPVQGVDLDFILDEYSRELGMEFNAFFLLKRTRSMVDRIKKNNPKSKEEAADNVMRYRDYVKKEHYLKPLPLEQVNRFKNITPEMLTPGYDYGALN